MTEFFQAVAEYRFLQYALLAGVLASVACGIMGSYILVKRITFLAGGIAHSILGGLGAAVYLRQVHGWPIDPMHGAVAAALLSAVIIGVVSLRARQNEDTIIGALWAVGMAAGVLFMARTPGYQADLVSYLFGNILMVTGADLWLIAGLDALVLLVVGLFYKPLLAVCFNEEYARLRGVPVNVFYLLLLCLAALSVVVLIQVVGLVLVIALLTLPAAIARQWTATLPAMMTVACLLGMVFTSAGLALSYQPNLPAGATIILMAAAGYLLTLLVHAIGRRGPGPNAAKTSA